MRKLLPLINISSYGMALPPVLLQHSFVNVSALLTSPSLAPSPSPSLSPSPYSLTVADLRDHPNFLFFPAPFVDSAFDLATISIISGLLLLSILSLFFIFHLRLTSRKLQHLENFNSFWTVRLMLVAFASFWAMNEVIRLPHFRINYIYPIFPWHTLDQQVGLCKLHVVLSFGLFQPGFFVILLFLVSISVQKKNPSPMWALASVFVTCCPVLLLQAFVVFFSPLDGVLPTFMHLTSIVSIDIDGNKTVFCMYPLLSCIILAAFAIAYSLAFLVSCWRVALFVINKSIRVRINVLTCTIMISLPVQILCLGLSPLWMPEDRAYGAVMLIMFLAIAGSVAVGEVILVIRPIIDALAAGGDSCRWKPEIRLGRPQVDRNQNL